MKAVLPQAVQIRLPMTVSLASPRKKGTMFVNGTLFSLGADGGSAQLLFPLVIHNCTLFPEGASATQSRLTISYQVAVQTEETSLAVAP